MSKYKVEASLKPDWLPIVINDRLKTIIRNSFSCVFVSQLW